MDINTDTASELRETSPGVFSFWRDSDRSLSARLLFLSFISLLFLVFVLGSLFDDESSDELDWKELAFLVVFVHFVGGLVVWTFFSNTLCVIDQNTRTLKSCAYFYGRKIYQRTKQVHDGDVLEVWPYKANGEYRTYVLFLMRNKTRWKLVRFMKPRSEPSTEVELLARRIADLLDITSRYHDGPKFLWSWRR